MYVESLGDDSRCNYSSPGLMSIDSAVESWGSHATDNNNGIIASGPS